jgi:hypothetical protein
MFKTARGFGVLEKGNPYLIVSITRWQNTIIELEQFSFIVGPDEASITILPSLRTEVKTRLGPFPENPKFESEKLLENELILSKQHYLRWLYEQIGDKAFAQAREVVWQETNEIVPFALMYFKLNNEERIKLKQLLENTYCEELKDFIEKVFNLKLNIEKSSK